MPRPSGAPFAGERLPQDDGDILAGTPTQVGVGFELPVQLHSDDTYLSMTVGDSYLVIAAREDTYLETGDTGLVMSWFIRARGTGTISVRDDSNFDWDYALPANDLGTVAISTAGWAEYNVTTPNLDVDEILGWWGQRFSVTVDSGSVDISQVALQIYPAGGALGGFATWPGYTNTSSSTGNLRVREYDVDYGYPIDVDDSLPDPEDAWDGMMGLVIDPLTDSDPVRNEDARDPDSFGAAQAMAFGIQFLGDTETVVFSDEWRAVADLVGQVMTVRDSTAPVSPNPGGEAGGPVDGTDYIRRPDRVTYDFDAYVSNFTVTNVWDDPHIWVHNEYDPNESAYDGNTIVTVDDYVSVATDDYEDLDDNLVPFPHWTTGTVHDTFGRSNTGDAALAITVPSEGTMLQIFPSLMEGAIGYAGTGRSWHTTSAVFITGTETDPDDPGFQYLQYRRSFSDYDVWVPAGRVTKLRQNQRGDGLGRSPRRARGHQSRQASNRQRDYR